MILSREQVAELRKYADQESGIGPAMVHRVCDSLEFFYAKCAALEKVRQTSQALKSAAWIMPIQQIMYGDSTVLREYNDALAAYDAEEKRNFK